MVRHPNIDAMPHKQWQMTIKFCWYHILHENVCTICVSRNALNDQQSLVLQLSKNIVSYINVALLWPHCIHCCVWRISSTLGFGPSFEQGGCLRLNFTWTITDDVAKGFVHWLNQDWIKNKSKTVCWLTEIEIWIIEFSFVQLKVEVLTYLIQPICANQWGRKTSNMLSTFLLYVRQDSNCYYFQWQRVQFKLSFLFHHCNFLSTCQPFAWIINFNQEGAKDSMHMIYRARISQPPFLGLLRFFQVECTRSLMSLVNWFYEEGYLRTQWVLNRTNNIIEFNHTTIQLFGWSEGCLLDYRCMSNHRRSVFGFEDGDIAWVYINFISFDFLRYRWECGLYSYCIQYSINYCIFYVWYDKINFSHSVTEPWLINFWKYWPISFSYFLKFLTSQKAH